MLYLEATFAGELTEIISLLCWPPSDLVPIRLQSKLRIGLAEKTVLAALAHAAVLSEVPKVPPAQLAARLEEV